MAARLVRRLALVSGALLLPAAVQAQQAKPRLQLIPGTTTVTLRANRVQCSINSIGEICLDPTGSPVYGGGFWPRGTIDNYIYNGGLQVAARIMGTSSAGFPWPGDTVGAFFFDPRGDQYMGRALTRIFDWLKPADRLLWPSAARALDTSLFAASLLGQPAVSDQDTWVRYAETTRLRGGRKHAAGVLVEQRTLAFDRPGLTDVIFFVFRLVNITAKDPARYQGLAAAGYGPSDIAEIASLGADFQSQMGVQYSIQIPDSGYALDSLYVAFAQDADVGNASLNYSNFNLVFGTSIAWKSNFSEPTWQFPLDVFQPPFAQAPGFLGEAFLRAPTTNASGPIAIGSNTTGGAPFPDAVGVSALWRKLSANILLTEGTCSVPNPKVRHFCQLVQVAVDTRYFMSSGPVRLGPGQSTVLIVAQVQAAAVQSAVAPYIGGDLKPGLPVDGARLVSGLDTLRVLDRAAGWVTHSDVNGDGVIEPNEVITTPYSLFWKIQLAQAVVNAKFLVPEPPEEPSFFLVPGDGRVTVVWQKSATETTGDPFFDVASNPVSPLYDPNYRRYDVEGYRIWRGTSASNMRAIAQLDYTGTSARDYTGQFAGSDYGPSYGQQCAPELGVTTSCPAFPATIGLRGNVIQVPPGGRILLANGAIATLRADTAVTGGASGRSPLADGGVPFVFIDSTARNGQSYLYAVTAFDVNSIRSGPSTLESPLVPKGATPRVQASQIVPGTAVFTLTGRNNTVLDPGAPVPTIDPATGIFSGPEPPTNGLSIAFTSYLPFAASGTLSVRVDSIVPSYDCLPLGSGTCTNGKYHLTVAGPSGTTSQQVSFVTEGTTGPSVPATYAFPAIRFQDSLVGRFGGDSTYALDAHATISMGGAWFITSQGRAAANGYASRYNGPRWWAGTANETLANPNGNVCTLLSSAACVDTAGNVNAGAGIQGGNVNGVLPNIAVLWSPEGYLTVTNPMRSVEIITSSVARAADFKVYWGATAGKVDSVIDVTHNVAVPFGKAIRASWGVLNDSSFTNTPAGSTLDGNNNFLTFTDLFCVDPIPTILATCGSVPTASSAFLMDHAIANPMNYKPASSDNTGGAALVAQGATGSGFIFYLNGKFFVMQLASALADCCQNIVWNARFYSGYIRGAPGTFSFAPVTRPPAVPGLTISVDYTASQFNLAASNDTIFEKIHTVPDPYYVSNPLETAGGPRVLRFVNVPSQAIIRIYSSSGILVAILSHNDQTGGGEQAWDLRTRNSGSVASGVYFYLVEAPDGRRKIGRFTVVSPGR